jgi:hypothetical protein
LGGSQYNLTYDISYSEEVCLLKYNAAYFGENQPVFWRNVLPPSWLKSKPREQSARSEEHSLCQTACHPYKSKLNLLDNLYRWKMNTDR